MAEAKKKKEVKEVKDYTVLRKSIGSALVFKGKRIILNNGLPQSTLKALYALGMKAILKAEK
jgi:hypothetical protein